MKKIYTLFLVFGAFSFTHFSAQAAADPDCLKMWKQAQKTCKGAHRCMFEALNAAGFDIINDGRTVFCRGDANKGMKSSSLSQKKKSFSPTRDRSKRKSGIRF